MNGTRRPQHKQVWVRKDRAHMSFKDRQFIGGCVKHKVATDRNHFEDLSSIGKTSQRFRGKRDCRSTSYNPYC